MSLAIVGLIALVLISVFIGFGARKLPNRVYVGYTRFVFSMVLDTILSLAIAFGPSATVFHFLSPGTFGERVVAMILCGGLFGIMCIPAVFFWIWFATETTGI